MILLNWFFNLFDNKSMSAFMCGVVASTIWFLIWTSHKIEQPPKTSATKESCFKSGGVTFEEGETGGQPTKLCVFEEVSNEER